MIIKNKRLGVALIITIAILVSAGVFLASSGYGDLIANRLVHKLEKPSEPFDPSTAAVAPDYSSQSSWAALPAMADPSDLIPKGLDDAAVPGDAEVDVFFIHPTGYLSGASWTSPLDENSKAEENTQWMMAYQASAFNACCNVYAPRYREASIYSYMTGSDSERDRVLAFAYQDVQTAFDYFVKHYNKGRPFILASHSQGTHHAKRLIEERIDRKPLQKQLVAAYTLGSVGIRLTPQWLSTMSIEECQSASETGCLIHWDTVSENAPGLTGVGRSICTNPLVWNGTTEKIAANHHRGALPVKHLFNRDFGRDNSPTDQTISNLAAPLAKLSWAQCSGGKLKVKKLSETDFLELSKLGNYHILDYSLFYVDIRENAKLRSATWLATDGTN